MSDVDALISDLILKIKENVKDNAIIACSGGIDSTVAAYLVHTAIGDKATSIFIDTGLLRTNESKNVKKLFEKLGISYKIVDKHELFLNSLKNVVDPEEKRMIVGKCFIDSFIEVAKNINSRYLIQGTIAPDWIESGDSVRDTIKSHHNVGGLPSDIPLIVYEPLRDLYKDEIRKIAERIGIENAYRQPFPGPGFAIRVYGDVTEERVNIVRGATDVVERIVEDAVKKGLIRLPWQYFAIFLPVKSVGVKGDLRSYGYTIVVRIVESTDAMTASVSNIPFDVLEDISSKICSLYSSDISRVLYDITSKPPGTIEWE
ncbi:MAG: glutamine-hydrolyzing GMP synthase [Candidatus Thermoplasmatota archaeon]|jgi:GMP synthase (glutamine-hydrolysing)|nr:glutamine-hydrolyzing GMP synthase [Candidatus Thermoplasmatota archaeon]MCL5963664.1 glutamine-hydrolyzing GMP synthase [Candidatus Thermoplasmatota archaeon]